MFGGDATQILFWPIAFGLFGFIEPCAIGATLVFIKTLEGHSARVKLGQVLAFTASRTVLMGLLGVVAAFVGSWFLGLQKIVWILVGLLYAADSVKGLARVQLSLQPAGLKQVYTASVIAPLSPEFIISPLIEYAVDPSRWATGTQRRAQR